MARRPIIDRDEARTAARAKASDPTSAESRSNEDTGLESITIEPSGSAPDTETAEIKLYNVDSGGSKTFGPTKALPPHDDEPVEFDLPAGFNDDAISGPAAQAAALKANLANLRKDEDDAKSDVAQDDASGIDTNALDDTLGKTLDASTEQSGAPKDAELAAPFVPGGAVLSVGDAPDEDDPKANDIEDA